MADVGLYHWLSRSPQILWHSASREEDVGHYLPDERIYRLVMNLWHQSADEIEAYFYQWRALRPMHRLLHLVNDKPICEDLQSRGIPAIFVNQNCFLDESMFSIQPEIPKKHDAVYNARMAPFKRHHLLAEVAAPLIIGGIISYDDTQEYFDRVRTLLPQATFTHADVPRKQLNPFEVSKMLNTARVGICLSETEGTMFAATEYLLCGLPVVSTPSHGGRETWFEPRFSRMVPADPTAVAAAVRELITIQFSPELIRNATIARMSEHRHRFTAAVQRILTHENSGRDFAREFYGKFRHKCGEWRANRDVMHYRPQ